MSSLLLPDFSKAKVICVGDIMLDKFVYGDVSRISPEAPIPVMQIQRDFYVLGGAGNVVRNLSSLGAEVFFIGLVGNDYVAKIIDEHLSKLKNVKYILVENKFMKTPLKTRFVAQGQHLLRVDDEATNCEIPKQIFEKAYSYFQDNLRDSNCIILSDYNKGFLTEDFCQKIIQHSKAKVLIDPKGVNYKKYQGAYAIKPNLKEFKEVSKNIQISDSNDLASSANKILSEFNIQNMILTRGQDGMILINQKDFHHIKSEAREVYDVSGAGDTAIATLSACLGAKQSILDSCILANIASGIVVGKTGTATIELCELKNALEHQENNFTDSKVLNPEKLLELIKKWRRKNLKIGFTNGCFDLLHLGHLHLLDKAKKFCDRLIVGLNSDLSVSKLKGSNRPIQSEIVRSKVLEAIACVDAVVVFDEDTPYNIIELILPDVLVKGEDYNIDNVIGADLVIKNGGKVKLIDLKKGYSTTSTVEKIKIQQ